MDTPPRRLIPTFLNYFFLALLLLFLLPYLWETRPSGDQLRTDGTVMSYEASSTSYGADYAPVVSFRDATGQVHVVTMGTRSTEKPYAIGESVSMYYSPASTTVAFLEYDPNREFFVLMARIAAIPFFLLGVLFFILYLFRLPPEKMETVALCARIAVPWLVPLSVNAALSVLHINFPAHIGFTGGDFSYSNGNVNGWLLLGIILAGGLAFLYLLQWPLMVVRLGLWIWRWWKGRMGTIQVS